VLLLSRRRLLPSFEVAFALVNERGYMTLLVGPNALGLQPRLVKTAEESNPGHVLVCKTARAANLPAP
jgi:hypothetical protein